MQILPFSKLIERYYSGEAFVIFDTETSGLNAFHDDIVEIAGMTWQKDRKPQFFQELIRVNTDRMNGGAWNVHKIPKEEIEKAREPKEVLMDFVKFCGGRTLVAHNVKFDYDFLNFNLLRHGLPQYSNEWAVCSLTYAREQNKPGKLMDLASSYKIKFKTDELHRALKDVHVLKEVLDKMMKENEPEEMQYSLIL